MAETTVMMVVTPMMTPISARKLRSLCAHNARRATRRTSTRRFIARRCDRVVVGSDGTSLRKRAGRALQSDGSSSRARAGRALRPRGGNRPDRIAVLQLAKGTEGPDDDLVPFLQ